MSRDNRHEYAQAVGAAAAHNVTDPWRVAAAVANDAAWHVGKRIVEHGTRHEEEEASAQTLESTGLQPDEFRVNVKDLADEADPRALPAVETPVAAEASEQSATPDAGDIGTAEEGAHSGVKQDVILRLETLTVRETKYAMGVVWAATLIAFGALFAEFGVKLQWDDSSRILHHDTVDIINVVVGSILACQLLRSLVWLSFVVVRTWQTKRVWKRRRLRNVVFFFIEIIAQLINVVTLIASNAYAIHNKCSWLSNATAWLNFVTWTCWNTIFLIFLIQVCSPMPQKVLRLPLPSRKARPHSNRPPPHIPGSKAPSGPSKDLPLNEPSKTLPPHEPSNNLPPNEPSKDVHQHKAASASHHDLSKGATELSKNFHSTVQELPKNQHTKAASASHHDLVKGATELCKGVLQPFKTVHSHEPTLIVDGSMWLHLPKYLLWLLTEATLIALCCYQYYHSIPTSRRLIGDGCNTVAFTCQQEHVSIVLTALVAFWIMVYCLWFAKYLIQEFHRLQKLPYTPHRISNTVVRINTRLRLPFVAVFLLCFALLWGVKVHSCFSFVLSWQGLLPMQIIETSVIVAWSFIGMPKDPKGKPLLMQVWLQEFCWSYKSREAKLKQRSQSAPDNAELAAAPMFCFEDAVKLLYWTLLIYDYKEAEQTNLTLEGAKELYGLVDHELLWEQKHDTKCLLAFGPNAIVVAFRGTASLKNASADIQAWQAVHPPLRGKAWRRPKVHAGFLKSWLAGNLKDKVVSSVLQHLQDHKKGGSANRILVTGHSLGGALATLCAFDIAAAVKQAGATAEGGKPVDVSCYTFGAPRTGNRAFRNEFNSLVPNCWGIINDQDVVTRGGKMVFLYSRPGQRVLVNARGDMIVRPSWVEASLQRLPGGSVAHHLLAQYYNSMCVIILQQFDNKVIHGGMEGIVEM